MKKNDLAGRLDWNKMLGFEQLATSEGDISPSSRGRLAAKVGNKPAVGMKPTETIGRIGMKVGLKPRE